MKKITNLCFLVGFFCLIALGCSNSSDDYNVPRDEEEESLIHMQMVTDTVDVNG
ncbi:hypothetical protein [Flagellimonas flava]|uniref:Uncharacterized protein n=1 Tax=Flagellimonas flava TaxID=570519 RepID=A0A1M5ISA3_9FLAO|nr:hypothetical protein [Allomuricauda flava]SHG31197.1 hypothetical protein SAMN04488116_0898 [Allomuricauda flava]